MSENDALAENNDCENSIFESGNQGDEANNDSPSNGHETDYCHEKSCEDSIGQDEENNDSLETGRMEKGASYKGIKPFDIVFSRRKKDKKTESQEQLLHCQEPDDPQGKIIPEIIDNSETVDDSDLPIAIQKGVRSCTKHPLSNFVSYEKLSPSFRAFTSQLSCREIPNNI